MKLNDAYKEKYPKTAGTVGRKWEIATGTPFSWESISRVALCRFADWLCNNVARSSARQYCAQLKAVLDVYSDADDLPNGWRKALTVKDDESQNVYLTEQEIARVIAYKCDTSTEAAVKQQFILGCLTGARHSDYSAFTPANVTETGMLVYVSQKTHIKAELPLAPVAREILFGKEHPFAGAYRQEVSDPTFNDTIRRICNLCDIDYNVTLYRRGGFWTGKKYEAVSSHTSRRSFCTNLYLRCRDLLLVSKLAGHTSVTMTERYICCGLESLTENAMRYFSAF